jgi:ribosomal protein S18 acetylase RimI-like enzyme
MRIRMPNGNEGILIREANESDLPAIEQLLANLIDTLDDAEGMDIKVALETYKRLLHDATSHFLVADTNGNPIGLINFTVRQTVLHRSPSALIDEIVVAGSHQKKGVGKQLVMAVIARCKALGYCEVEVSTEKTNVRAREFYRKCGFEERGTLFEADL